MGPILLLSTGLSPDQPQLGNSIFATPGNLACVPRTAEHIRALVHPARTDGQWREQWSLWGKVSVKASSVGRAGSLSSCLPKFDSR